MKLFAILKEWHSAAKVIYQKNKTTQPPAHPPMESLKNDLLAIFSASGWEKVFPKNTRISAASLANASYDSASTLAQNVTSSSATIFELLSTSQAIKIAHENVNDVEQHLRDNTYNSNKKVEYAPFEIVMSKFI